MGFETKNYNFCILFARTMTLANFQKKHEIEQKTTKNVPKTVDNHQEQLVLGLGYQL